MGPEGALARGVLSARGGRGCGSSGCRATPWAPRSARWHARRLRFRTETTTGRRRPRTHTRRPSSSASCARRTNPRASWGWARRARRGGAAPSRAMRREAAARHVSALDFPRTTGRVRRGAPVAGATSCGGFTRDGDGPRDGETPGDGGRRTAAESAFGRRRGRRGRRGRRERLERAGVAGATRGGASATAGPGYNSLGDAGARVVPPPRAGARAGDARRSLPDLRRNSIGDAGAAAPARLRGARRRQRRRYPVLGGPAQQRHR